MLEPPLTDLNYLRSLLTRLGASPRREAGQNFLICPEVVTASVMMLKAGPGQITELGAGLGTLTQALVSAGFKVKALERDRVLAPEIIKHIPAKLRSQLITQMVDLREVDWSWPEPYQVAGNIPYNLSGFIIRKLTQLEPAPAGALLLVQKEVAERMLGKPPELSLLGLTVTLWGQGKTLLKVPRNCFWPSPQVDSRLLYLTPTPTVAFPEREHILRVAKVFFQARRKQMFGVLKRSFALNDQAAKAVLATAGIQEKQRPQEVGVEQWRALTKHLMTNDQIPMTIQ